MTEPDRILGGFRYFDSHITDVIGLGTGVRVHGEGTNEWGRVVRVRRSTVPGWEGYGYEYRMHGDSQWWLTGPDGIVRCVEKAT